MKIINIMLPISAVLFYLIVSPACTSTTSLTTTIPTTSSSTGNIVPNPSAYTVSLSSTNTGESIRFDMSIQDSKGNNVTLDGHISIKVYNESSPPILLYQKEFDITSSQFISYTGSGLASYYLTLNPPIKVFEWSSPLTEFITSTHGTRGDTSLTFTNKDGKTFTNNSYVLGIPSSTSTT